MTDQELFELLQLKTPDELTVAEIEQLARRMRESSQLREALLEQVEMEEYLEGALGRIDLSIESILSRSPASPGSRFSLLAFCGLGACAAAIGAAVYFSYPDLLRLREPPKQIAKTAPEQGAAPPLPAELNPAAANPETNPADPAGDHAAAEKVAAAKPAPAQSENPPGGAPMPWAAENQLAAPPRPMEVIALDGFPNGYDPPTLKEMSRWFQRSRWNEGNQWNVKTPILEGVAPFLAPWTTDTVMRVAFMFDPQRIKIHFFQGDQGISVCFYGWPKNIMAAYAVSRGPKMTEQEMVKYHALLATDEERNWRSYPQIPQPVPHDGPTAWTANFRFTGTELLVSRGELILMRIPFAGLPQQTFFQGQGYLRALAMTKTNSPAAPPEAARPTVQDETQVTKLPWKKTLHADCKWTDLPDGSVEMSAKERGQQPSWASFPLPAGGPYELIFELDKATVQGRVFIGDHGEPRKTVGVVLCDPTKSPMIRPNLDPGDFFSQGNANLMETMGPMMEEHVWIKMLYTCSCLKTWIGQDGVHWGRLQDPLENMVIPADCAGIMLGLSEHARTVRLKHFQIREFPALKGLAPAELVARAPVIENNWRKDWFDAVAAKKPGDIELGLWQRACAVRLICSAATQPSNGQPPRRDLQNNAVQWLFEDSLSRPAPIADRFALLDELARVVDAFSDERTAKTLALDYQQLGRLAYLEGEHQPFTLAYSRILNSPLFAQSNYQVLSDPLARIELIGQTYAGESQAILDLCNWLRLGNYTNPLMEWAEATAGQQLGHTSLTTLSRPELKHPLVDDTSKEGYNVLSEFDAALNADAYRDACQILATAGGKPDLGLMPTTQDKRLSLSLSGAVAMAMQDHPDFRKVLSEQFGPVGNLRVKQAMAAGEVAAVSVIPAQFPGTEAAVQASLWLGDRALSTGDAAQALTYFRAARAGKSITAGDQIAWRLRLTGALLGENEGQPPAAPVDLDGNKFSPAEFESLIAHVRQQRASAAQGAASGDPYNLAWQKTIPPAGQPFTLTRRANLDGEIGDAPGDFPFFVKNPAPVDWAARQTSVALAGGQIIVSNRYQIAAYQAKSGDFKWRAGLGGAQGRTHDWSLAPMRPLVVGGQIICRQLTKAGPKLVSVKEDGGHLQWETRASLTVASDPILIQGQLYAVTAAFRDQEWQMSLAEFNAATGELRWEKPLVRFRSNWQAQRVCELAQGDGMFLLVGGGSVTACDFSGNVQWSRREEWIPIVEDGHYGAQHQQPPLIDGAKAYIQQPGVKTVDAIDIETGRLRWRRILPDVVQIVARLNDRLVVQTEQGLLGLALETGETKWTYDAPDLLEGMLWGGPGGLCVTRLVGQNDAGPPWRRTLVWIDPATGQETRRQPLEDPRGDHSRLGPLFTVHDRLWAFGADNENEPKRILYELTPKK
ncbi:MAG TPA: PQQ-binding-like beta-propeller repeat protein [Pirellulales bacterium]|jgi:outer membrane protein assembly factor BamB|nr:PQQ-binding-like beta-propeller repeat protein [Pirellulales bacterium]